ncbi:hypothetical protein M408DRAFT_30117 [Serendipita vermifera MAFF 305830]|uniref:Uncharacterized protein n=1 Tax=Serendipita vermifera MAFF 305830 TaxID=933852 RepID=A0A0C3AL14_SERVB|nr:hypothetical protein M408DRAFT_30117 [Serendipita vermifera MAFF 305830]
MNKPLSLEKAEVELEPQPGTLLKAVAQEDRFLDEFMTFMRKRIELDAQHLANLKGLQDNCNPDWRSSSIWPFISPFIVFCADEINHLESHIIEATACLDRIPHSSPPLPGAKEEFNAFDMPEIIKSPYLEYLRCYEVASSERSVQDLIWYRDALPRYGFKRLLPESERAYRQAVLQQQAAAELASRWYRDVFPEILEQHQQRAEAVKCFLHGTLTRQSLLASRLSSSNSTAIYDTILFSSSKFIAPHHEQMNKEKGHPFLKEVCYRNHAADGRVVKPIFGTDIVNTVALAHDILRELESAGFIQPRDLGGTTSHSGLTSSAPRELFKLEQDLYESGITAMQQSHLGLWHTLEFALMTAPPLLPFSNKEISLYSKGIPPDKMDALLKTRVPVARQAIMALVRQFWDYKIRNRGYEIDAHLNLTGRSDSEMLVEDLWRKCDIDEDCPFPRGVERVWDGIGKHFKVVWKKTGEEYRRQPGKVKTPVRDAPFVLMNFATLGNRPNWLPPTNGASVQL